MADYPPVQIVDMITVLGECNNNYRAPARRYAERFSDRRHPSDKTIRSLNERARGGHRARQRKHREYDENDARVVTILSVVHFDPNQ